MGNQKKRVKNTKKKLPLKHPVLKIWLLLGFLGTKRKNRNPVKKIQPSIFHFWEKLYIQTERNNDRNILYEPDFVIFKNWRPYFFTVHFN